MTKTKKYTMCALITAVFWIISQIIPTLLSSFFPGNIAVSCVFMLLLLFEGWIVSCMISKGVFTSCINTNLFIFGCIETFGLLQVIVNIISDVSYASRYGYGVNSMLGSDFRMYYAGLLLYEILYIFLCYYLSKKTSTFGIPKHPTEQET